MAGARRLGAPPYRMLYRLLTDEGDISVRRESIQSIKSKTER